MGPRNGVPATAKARLRASVTRYASPGAPRGDDPSRVRWVRFAKMRGSPLSCPLPLRERAQWSAHELERVRGSRITPSPVLARGSIELPSPARGKGAIMPTAFVALFTLQTAHLVPAAHFCARGLQPCFTD